MLENPQTLTFQISGADKRWLIRQAAANGTTMGQLLRKMVIEERQRIRFRRAAARDAVLVDDIDADAAEQYAEEQLDIEELTGPGG